jgi:demethylsterigmatocystin 6-O-methyltransferase
LNLTCHSFDSCGPAVQALPSFLAENNYQDITDNKNTPFQKGFTTKLTCFEWLPQQPKLFAAMQKVMTRMQSSEWIKGFALLDKEAGVVELKQKDVSEKPFLVDVGGGHGHQCVQLLKQYPNLHGHLVLEDLPQALDKLPPIDGVEIVTQDFFEKQTIQGAHFLLINPP